MYRDNTGWFQHSELRKLILNFVNKDTNLNILEIGSYEGISSCFFSDNLLDNKESKLICVDPFDISDKTTNVKDTTFEIFLSNISKSKNFNKILFKKQYSDDFFVENKDTFNFIYIDGSHEPPQVKKDLENCFNVIEKNGIIWMDDYLGGYPVYPMKNVIDEFLETNRDKIQLIHKGYQIAFKKL